jgi:hypothetical protein
MPIYDIFSSLQKFFLESNVPSLSAAVSTVLLDTTHHLLTIKLVFAAEVSSVNTSLIRLSLASNSSDSFNIGSSSFYSSEDNSR